MAVHETLIDLHINRNYGFSELVANTYLSSLSVLFLTFTRIVEFDKIAVYVSVNFGCVSDNKNELDVSEGHFRVTRPLSHSTLTLTHDSLSLTN